MDDECGEPHAPQGPSAALEQIKKVSDILWDMPTSFKQGMRVPGRFYATKNLMQGMDDRVFSQLANVACLPGIIDHAFCMPDAHSGYGFPIGGVAAFDPDKEGIISPGGIGFDINCGMRLITTNLTVNDVKPKIKQLVDDLYKAVPAGVGCKGFVRLTPAQFKEVMVGGTKWCVENGYAWEEDVERSEDFGCIDWADPDKVSQKAIGRGINQLGTLGSGNHYLEVQLATAKNIFDAKIAKAYGITIPDQICIMVHCGSRGFGHQIGSDYLQIFEECMKKYGIEVADRELACAPFTSKEGQDYFKAMACAANSAFANRQVITHQIRKVFAHIFGQDAESLGMKLVYDVAHNIAKVEKHKVHGKSKEVIVHRKGATRAFGPGRKELAPIFRDVGQPVIIGGSMETGSFLLAGTEGAMEQTWGSTAHGAGRTMSRTAAKKLVRGDKLQKDMEAHGIYVKTASYSGLAEEAGFAYKSISEVIDAVHKAGISKKVVGLVPIGNVKG